MNKLGMRKLFSSRMADRDPSKWQKKSVDFHSRFCGEVEFWCNIFSMEPDERRSKIFKSPFNKVKTKCRERESVIHHVHVQ